MNKLKLLAATFVAIFSLMFSLNPVLAANLDCSNPQSAQARIQCGACEANGGTCPDSPGKTVNDTIATAINLLSIAAGVAAVIFIIIAGFRYVTSAGSAEATKGAKNTILYAIIGLVIVALAQIIVHFVLNKTNTATGSAG